MSSKKNRKKLFIILGVVVLIAALVAANLVIKHEPKGKKVDVTEVERDSLVQTVSASGKIQPTIDVNISANVSGRILYLGAKEGDEVKRGQLLVQIEDENYVAALEMYRYALASATASLEEARSNLKRVQELHTGNMASDAQLEAAQATVKRLEAETDRARATVTQGEDALAKTRIYAPINGRVTQLLKEVGEMAIGATFSFDVIMVVGQLKDMEVNAEVNENDVVLVSVGDDVKIEVFAIPDTSFPGVVTEIAHSGIVRGLGTAEEVTNFEVKVAVLDQVPKLRPGMSATVEIITDRRESTLIIPQEAVAVRTLEDEKKKEDQARKGKKGKFGKKKEDEEKEKKKERTKKEDLKEVVFIAQNDSAWVKQVVLGIHSDTHFEILSGVEEGDLVVTGPFRELSRELHSGDRIKFTPLEEENEKPKKEGEEKTKEKQDEQSH